MFTGLLVFFTLLFGFLIGSHVGSSFERKLQHALKMGNTVLLGMNSQVQIISLDQSGHMLVKYAEIILSDLEDDSSTTH